MNILAFGASHSKNSINQQFASYVAKKFSANNHVSVIQLTDYDVPVYTVDREAEIGFPQEVKLFLQQLQEADFLIISLAEHNGSYTASFKNLFDWTSRVEMNLFANKKLFLLSTSPGPKGGRFVLEAAKVRFPIHGAEIVGSFSLPKFYDNFDANKGIIDVELKTLFDTELEKVQQALLA
jgi:chromate reductase, NAD(P)H dehydrogenase (quinone)